MGRMMFWKDPERNTGFGAGEVKGQQLGQRRNSGKFDIHLMADAEKGRD